MSTAAGRAGEQEQAIPAVAEADLEVDLEVGSPSPSPPPAAAAAAPSPQPPAATPQASAPSASTASSPFASAVAAVRRGRRVKYPATFMALSLCTAFVSCFWMVDFFMVAKPALQEAESQHVDGAADGKCHYSDVEIQQSCRTILACFGLFAVIRMVVSVKGIGRRVEESLNGQRGPCARYACITIVHGPLFVFATSSLLFWAQLLAATETCADMNLLRILRLFACYSSLVSLLCCMLAFWHALLVGEAMRRRGAKEGRRAPPGFVDTMSTVPYDPELFGQEDGKRYYAECPICLGDFGPEDEIKVTQCGHAFHKDCLGRWLRKERTCALCRQDVTRGVGEASEEAGAPAPGGGAEARPPPRWRAEVFAQKLQYDGGCFVLFDVFGAASERPSATEQGGNQDCVICLSEPRDTAVLPCRHMCFCSHCAGIVRLQCERCPVCRQKVQSLLQFRGGRFEDPLAAGKSAAL